MMESVGFILVVNDSFKEFKLHKCLLFADDLQIYLVIGNANDYKLLQDLIRLQERSNKHCMELYVLKCLLISFTRTKKYDTFLDQAVT